MNRTIVEPLSKKKIEYVAGKVRALFDRPNGKFPIVSAIESLSIPDENTPPQIELEIMLDDEMPDEYATYCPLTKTLRIRESVYNNACNGVGRDRFTLAHELGHIIFHREGYGFARAEVIIPPYKDPEWQANTFASMLLLPRDQIKGLSAEDAARIYGTSLQAAQIALKS